ncbi:YihY/virulence factor BrkB family protein [Aquimarina brevivitae]|uniref:Membrane protein n=1 Tax=Aquimarina brevivitae TaxID=323412 RepID=A0A4Q7PIG0_9FLAO|nr:YihY/virulence factor BrkB family protein [Aquimarina brevivitae]RZT00028.1 membrane protein [Aquimarina brevivitae]
MVKPKKGLKSFISILVNTFNGWLSNQPFQLSAAVSYYALFSFPALIIIVVQTTGLFYEKSKVKGRIMTEIQNVLGAESAQAVDSMVRNVADTDQSTFAIIVGIITLLYGATGMFISLQKSLNTIWNVQPNPKSEILKMIRDRFFSLGLILIIGFLLLISLVLTALITALTDWLQQRFPEIVITLLQAIDFLISLGLVTVLFALIFKYLPDVKIKWKDVWLGAFVTAILFVIGKYGLGLYFGMADPGSTFGAAGSIILILLWVSYSSLILFFGAEFTLVISKKYNRGILPASYAEKMK